MDLEAMAALQEGIKQKANGQVLPLRDIIENWDRWTGNQRRRLGNTLGRAIKEGEVEGIIFDHIAPNRSNQYLIV